MTSSRSRTRRRRRACDTRLMMGRTKGSAAKRSTQKTSESIAFSTSVDDEAADSGLHAAARFRSPEGDRLCPSEGGHSVPSLVMTFVRRVRSFESLRTALSGVEGRLEPDLPRGDAEFLELGDDVFTRRRGLHLLVDRENLPVGADVEG